MAHDLLDAVLKAYGELSQFLSRSSLTKLTYLILQSRAQNYMKQKSKGVI
jgi:DNA-directed RNA polymerase specialized sigma24 family protein